MKRLSRTPAAARATTSSAAPLPYISAVSIKVMPRSMPSRSADASSAARRRSSPMCQVPCPSAGTRSPSRSVTTRNWSLTLISNGFGAAEEGEPRGSVHPLIEKDKPSGRHQFFACREFDDGKRFPGQPACGIERAESRSGEATAVWRVEKRQAARQRGVRRAHRVPGHHPCAVCFAERRDVSAENRESLSVLLDKHCLGGAAGQRLETERARPGESIEHRRTIDGDTFGCRRAVRQNVEQRLAGAVAGRPYRCARRCQQPAAAM